MVQELLNIEQFVFSIENSIKYQNECFFKGENWDMLLVSIVEKCRMNRILWRSKFHKCF
jgi:hypothetical protein